MLENYNRYKVLKIFLDDPLEEFGLREISKMIKLAPVSVLNYLKEFEKEEIIEKKNKKGNPVYIAERENGFFKLYQKLSIQYELNKSGLIDYLWEKLAPECIILYGSYSKGEAIKESDIDLFIIGKEKPVNLDKFVSQCQERSNGVLEHHQDLSQQILRFQKRTSIIFRRSINNVSEELKNNLVNGIILKGYLRLNENKNNSGQRKSKISSKNGKR